MRNHSSLWVLFGISLVVGCGSQEPALDSAPTGAAAEGQPGSVTPGGVAIPEPGGKAPAGGTAGGSASDVGAAKTELQKRKAQMLTSFWENDTTVFQYAFANNNNDGYGYTSGRVGFTTSTGDASEVVECFDAAYKGAGNRMQKYASVLKALRDKMLASGQRQPSIAGLDALGNYTADWAATANTPATATTFNDCQDQRVDFTYWQPTAPIMKKWGLTTALARASLYDSIVVHGEENVNGVIYDANTDTGNPLQQVAKAPLKPAEESAWLQAFHKHRTALIHSSGAWRAAIARGANYERMRLEKNFELTLKIVTDARASDVFPGNGYPSNGYQACIINPDGSVSGIPQCTAPVSN
jgi:chitosanase